MDEHNNWKPGRRINHYPVDSVVWFVSSYSRDRVLSAAQRYPAFEHLVV